MEQHIEEFKQDEKSFIYFDLSKFKTNEEYCAFIEIANGRTAKYKKDSLYTITNVTDVEFDTETKSIIAKWMKFNEPYVKHGAVIGIDGIKRIMINSIFKLSGRKNMFFASNKEDAIEQLLKSED